MDCIVCGSELGEGETICGECGSPVEKQLTGAAPYGYGALLLPVFLFASSVAGTPLVSMFPDQPVLALAPFAVWWGLAIPGYGFRYGSGKVPRTTLETISRWCFYSAAVHWGMSLACLTVPLLAFSAVSGRGSARLDTDDRPVRRKKPALDVPTEGRVREDGRVVREGLLFDELTGQRIGPDGRIVEEEFLIDRQTGIALRRDGRGGHQVVKEGVLGDARTGVALRPDGQGGHRVVRDGLVFDEETGVTLDATGRPVKRGVVFDAPARVALDSDGLVDE